MKKALAQSLKSLKNQKQQQKLIQTKQKQPSTEHKPNIPLKKSSSISSVSIIASDTLFHQINFCFPLEDMDLSAKVVQILKKRIIKHGGKLFQKDDSLSHNKIYYYLVSPKVNRNKLNQVLNIDDVYFCCLNYHFINDCLSQDTILSEDEYWIPSLQSPQVKMNKQSKQTRSSKLSLKRDAPQDAYVKPAVKKLKTSTNPHLASQIATLKSMSDENSEIIHGIEPIDMEASKRKRNQQYWNQKKNYFVCQKVSEQSASKNKHHNEMIIQQLKKLQKIYQIEKDKGRVIAYSNAISIIKGLDFDIKNASDVNNIRGIGKKLIDKIQQILSTGKLQKIQKLQKNQKYEISEELERVWGIGPTKAVELYNKGIKSIQQLKKNENLLNKNQKLGLKYVDEFQQRIPRKEVGEILQAVKLVLSELTQNKTLHKIEACGSYRRGKQTCGDIDIIITRLDGIYEKDLLLNLIEKLQQNGLITDSLTMPGKNKQEKSLTYMGVCQLEGKLHRRIDIKYYPLQQFAFALLYFTGSDMFNRSMRLFARKKGYSLSDHGMVPVQKQGKDKKWEGKKIVCFQQKDIFDFLGLDYKDPKSRDV